MVSSIQKSRKRKLGSFTTKAMVIFCKGCVHVFFVEEMLDIVSSIAKMWPKMKDQVFKLNIWSIAY